MLALSNKTATNDLVRFTRIMIDNLIQGHGKKSMVGYSLSDKSDYGNALETFLINLSIQTEKNALDNAFIFELVQDFFDTFTASDSWLDQIDLNIKRELKRNGIKTKNKTTKQNKVG